MSLLLTLPYVDLYKIGKMNHRKGIPEKDLRRFLIDAIEILKSQKKAYYIKLDTRPYLEDNQCPET